MKNLDIPNGHVGETVDAYAAAMLGEYTNVFDYLVILGRYYWGRIS
jgi:hypothetical protein